MNFNEAESYLLSLGNEVTAMKLGLGNIRKLLQAIGDPQTQYLKVQVAGTNGKGSVCAFLNAICISAGVRVGMFTSPHLISITERIQFNGVPISEDDFAKYATKVRSVAEDLVANRTIESISTFFEQVTAIALLAFADAKVELAILETGLGGRLDATTAANAEIAVITRIDYDHQEYLGETMEEIAAEKAAIIHNGSTVVIGDQSPAALKVILDRCKSLDIIPQAATKQYIWGMEISGKSSVREFDVVPPTDLGVVPGLKGRHQVDNAHIAIMVAGTLAIDFGLPISEEQIKRGIENARHPGRLESIGRYLLDGAHNPSGAIALRAYLDKEIDRPITLVFGAMKDKEVHAITKEIFPLTQNIVLTEPSNSRAMKTSEIVSQMPEDINAKVYETNSVKEALQKAERVSMDDGIILITGSLYLVGESMRILRKRGKI